MASFDTLFFFSFFSFGLAGFVGRRWKWFD